VKQLADLFYARRIVKQRKRPDAVRQILDHDVLPAIGNRRLNTITTVTLGRIVDDMVARGAKSHAGKALAIIKQMFDWAAGRGYIESSPAVSLKADNFGVETATRQRALDTDQHGEAQAVLTEIPILWEALDAAPRLSPQIRYGIKILLLTGVRSGELRQAEWKDIDLEKAEWVVPVANQKLTLKQAKQAKPWIVPLSPPVVELFEKLKAAAGTSNWVLPSRVEGQPLTDKAMVRAITRLFELKDRNGKPLLAIAHFTAHDLRRTLRTHLSRLRVPLHVCEKCLNHSLGKLEEIYGTHTFLEERREALERWADTVELAINPRDNITVLEGRSHG
jgi:integrase